MAKISGVTSAVGALSLQALHETGTVPTIVATVKTGGQTISTTTKPPTLTAAQRTAETTCLEKLFQGAIAKNTTSTTTPTKTKTPTRTTTPTKSGTPSTTTPVRSGTGANTVSGSGILRFVGGLTSNPAALKCLTPAEQSYVTKVVVPEQTISQVLNPPTTNTSTSTYTVAGVDPSSPSTGLVTKAQVVSGTWFTAKPANEVLVNTAYASTKKLKVGGTITINSKTFTIVGLVSPTLTGDVSDLYFDLSTLQSMSSATGLRR